MSKQKGIMLGLKVVLLALFLLCTFCVFFSISVMPDDSMAPNIKARDVVVSYRLDKKGATGSAIVVEQDGVKKVLRVVATADDVVDITEEGLLINGQLQFEPYVYSETLAVEGGVEYPITLNEGEVFVLGDNRTVAVDSRIYGPVRLEETHGRVIKIIRSLNI